MSLTRRQFNHLALIGAACCAGTEAADGASSATESSTTSTSPSSNGPVIVEAGPLSSFKNDDVYDATRMKGVFVIRRDEKLFALSSICTHKGCKVRVQDDLSFLCKCHGSRYDRDGHVTHGPAKKDLPRLAIAVDSKQHVLVNTGMEVASTQP